MSIRNTSREWGWLSKSLHWLVAIGIAALIWLGLAQSDLPRGPERDEIRFIHASIALAVLALMTLRLAWRWMNTVPAHPPGIPGWQKVSATIVHAALYVAVFTQLVSGAMTIATNGSPLPFFGLFSVPLGIPENEDAHEFWEEIHEYTWIAVATLIGVHVLAALYNHFIARNDALKRMTIGVKEAGGADA